MRYMTFGDKIVIAFVIVIAMVISLLFMTGAGDSGELYVKIESCGKEYATYPLNNLEKTIEINTKFGYNEIKVYNGNVWVSKTDCDDKIEIHEGQINKEGQSLICLPNRLVISIVSGNEKIDGVTY